MLLPSSGSLNKKFELHLPQLRYASAVTSGLKPKSYTVGIGKEKANCRGVSVKEIAPGKNLPVGELNLSNKIGIIIVERLSSVVILSLKELNAFLRWWHNGD